MVKKARPVIVWNNRASIYFKKAYEQIKEVSYNNAEKVRIGLIKIIDSLIDHPEKYPPDKFKRNNPGNYRAFENTRIALPINTGVQKSEFYASDT